MSVKYYFSLIFTNTCRNHPQHQYPIRDALPHSGLRYKGLTSCNAVCPYLSMELGSAPSLSIPSRYCRSTCNISYINMTFTCIASCLLQGSVLSMFTLLHIFGLHIPQHIVAVIHYLICFLIAGSQESEVIQ